MKYTVLLKSQKGNSFRSWPLYLKRQSTKSYQSIFCHHLKEIDKNEKILYIGFQIWNQFK